MTRNLYTAMRKAKDPIPRGGDHLTPPTRAKRTFHSFRHTYARICMERGAELKWLQGQMGHATLAMTGDRYGHFGESHGSAKRPNWKGLSTSELRISYAPGLSRYEV